MFGGFVPGEYVVIGGRPSMGKTQLLVNMALNISVSAPVLFFSSDLSALLLSSRFLSCASGIAVDKILHNKLTDEQRAGLSLLVKEMIGHKILVNDDCGNSIAALRAECLAQIKASGVKVIMVDYLQMMSSGVFHKSRDHEIGHLSREFKNIAKDLNICVIVISQLNRSVEHRGGFKRPWLSDLRDSGAIEQDADKVIFLYRPEYYTLDFDEYNNPTTGLTEVIMAKNRLGSIGTIKLIANESLTGYRDDKRSN